MEDLIEEWKRAAAAPVPAARASESAHDLIGEWVRTLPPQLQAKAGAAVEPTHGPTPETDSDPFIRENAGFFRSVREARGHGNRSITDLVTGNRPDSWGDVATRTVAGGAKGIQSVAATIQQGYEWLKEKAASELAERGYVSRDTADQIAATRAQHNEAISRFNQYWDEANPGAAGKLGEIGGQILGTGPMLSTGALALRTLPGAGRVAQYAAANPGKAALVQGAATGAGANVLTSSASDAPIMEQAGWGAGVGGFLGPAGQGIGKLFGGAADRETAQLARLAMDKYKIPIRVDQISGNPMARFAGSVAQRTPGTGLAANVAEQQGAFNRALNATMGEAGDKVTTGVMAGAKSRLGNVFETELPKLEAHLNKVVRQRLTGIEDALPYLPAEDARIVDRLRSDIVGQFGKAAVAAATKSRATAPPTSVPISGKTVQALIAKGSPLDRAIEGGSSNVRYYASQLKDILLDAVGQTAKTGRTKTAAGYVQGLQRFQTARFQYKNMKTLEDLVEKSPTGDISPALLMGAVRKSFGNMAYGGGGDLADLARIGQRFMKEPPSSGTAERLTLMNLALGGAAGAAGVGAAAFDPEHFQRDAGILAGSILAARAGGAAIGSRMLARSAVRSGARAMPPIVGPVLTRGLPYFAPRQNPFALPPAQQNR